MATEQKNSGWHNFVPNTVSGILASVVATLIVAGGGWFLFTRGNNHVKAGNSVILRERQPNISVVDRDFKFTLQKISCGTKKFLVYEAKGEFCVLSFKVANQGKSTNSVPDSLWRLYVGDLEYGSVASEGSGFDELFPGTEGDGTIAFDVPVNSNPTSLHLQSDFLDGVPIEL